jgi:translation initiation factor SUI1
MSADIDTSLVPSGGFDAFADAAEQEENTAGADYVHIRVQQRNGKKSLTTVQVKWCLA